MIYSFSERRFLTFHRQILQNIFLAFSLFMYYIYPLKIKKTMMASPAYHFSFREGFFRLTSFFLFPFTKITIKLLLPSGGGIRLIEKRREEKRREEKRREEKETTIPGLTRHFRERHSRHRQKPLQQGSRVLWPDATSHS